MIKAFGIAILSFLVLDSIWFKFVVKDFNLKHLAEIGRIANGEFQILYGPAIVVYLLMALAVVFFALPKVAGASFLGTFLWGAFLGLIVYGVFDMTNMAVLKKYSLSFALVDMAWGAFAFGTVTLVTKFLSELGKS